MVVVLVSLIDIFAASMTDVHDYTIDHDTSIDSTKIVSRCERTVVYIPHQHEEQ